MIMGIGYVGVGGIISIAFIFIGRIGPFILIPLIFLLLGAGFIVGVNTAVSKKKKIAKLGKKYAAKIYGYVENTSFMVLIPLIQRCTSLMTMELKGKLLSLHLSQEVLILTP